MVNIQIGEQSMTLGSRYLTELRDCNDILHDVRALRARMQEDGYLLIRGFHNREAVLKARTETLMRLSAKGNLNPACPLEDGVIGPDNKGAGFQGTNRDMPALLDVVNADAAMNFFANYLGGPVLTYDVKWLRAVAHGEFTGAHYDVVYMGRGTRNLHTLWTPLGDVSYELGGLALCLGSQHFEKIKQTYGQMDVDRDHVVGWFSQNPKEVVDQFGGIWATTEFAAGDAIIFGMYMLHGSVTNTSNRYRISVDTRYQLACEPVDDRWVGAEPKMHYAWQTGPTVAMDEARKKWGI